MTSHAARVRRARQDARDQVMTALRELGEPARFDQIVNHVLGTSTWGAIEEAPYERALTRLVNRGDVIRFLDVWQTRYRLATDADRAAAEDALEVARLMSRWEPAP